MHRALVLSLVSLAFPFTAGANVIITEIMYDLPGTDTGREWIEVRNEGSTDVDLSLFKLFEANTNHKITAISGGVTLSPGSFAVIADNSDKFLIDHSGYSGILFDSAFSLANTTETLLLKNGDVEEDSATYSSETGAAGDGQTLQLIGSSFETGNPTPGASNISSPPPVEDTEEVETPIDTGGEKKETTPVSTPAPAEAVDELGIPLSMTVKAGGDRIVTVGAAEFFKAQAYRKTGVLEKNAKYRWNFGNGFMRHGKDLLFQYNYPGNYVALVTVEGPNDSKAFARFTVSAKEAKLAVAEANTSGITIANNDARELNLSLWSIRSDDRYFLIPEDTILLPGSAVVFPSEVTQLFPQRNSTVALVYPNGQDAAVYREVSITEAYTALPSPVSSSVTPATVISEVAPQEINTIFMQTASRDNDGSNEDENLLPSAGAAPLQNEMMPWLLGLSVLLVSGLTGLFVIRNKMQNESVQDFTIIDGSPKASSFPMVIKDKESN